MTRVAIYTRISTDEAHQPYSLEAQATRLSSYIASQEDWQFVRTFSDQQSGATTERPQLQRMLSEARAGRFDLALVYRSTASVDRYGDWRRCSTSSTVRESHSAPRPSRSTPRQRRGE